MALNSLGILINSFDISQLSISILHNLNKIQNVTPYVFYNELPQYHLKDQSFTTLASREAYGFQGHLIATCLHTAKQALECFAPVKKYLYVWDFEWLNKQYNYDELQKIYLNDDFTLIARSSYHKEIIDNCWKQSIIIEDFNHEQLTRLFK